MADALADLRTIVEQLNSLLMLAETRLAQAILPTRAGRRGVLTAREREVLELVARGMPNAGIADQLVPSAHTVHRHVSDIMTKLGVSSRAAGTAKAAVLGTPLGAEIAHSAMHDQKDGPFGPSGAGKMACLGEALAHRRDLSFFDENAF